VDTERGVVYGQRGAPVGHKTSHGYLAVNTRVGVGQKRLTVHRMVWESAHGPVPEGLELNHINGNKADNRLANLELVTAAQNTAHAFALGLTKKRGEHNPSCRITEADVREIRRLATTGATQRAIAGRFPVSPAQVSRIIKRKKWAHVE
jgi:hypothetical protein